MILHVPRASARFVFANTCLSTAADGSEGMQPVLRAWQAWSLPGSWWGAAATVPLLYEAQGLKRDARRGRREGTGETL